MPNNGKMQCSCGHVQGDGIISDKKKKREEITVVTEKQGEVLPVTKYDCKKCVNNEAYFWTVQTRSADEPETKFYKCTKCGNVNREY